ncbi:hypothetical protein F5B22DRAFT_4834 [Xylaria bambusicola]|uniref:uncharacterized protein n=1 Tax=Xylaria bambusicola TaxID=326684 RepID=UPI002008E97C|nr:uncharacterized protein F5B22DRAFT_4834 [Xylaria bambusicola]KAI0527806.1 hypothetical protein F5B22DRAFT_4834 [Xylaria bambusicola]
MSVPPQLIRVKRKATEEAPVSYLRVQETKRHRSNVFVYQRQNEEATFAENIPAQIQKPIIHTSPQSRRTPAFQSTARQNIPPNKHVSGAKNTTIDNSNGVQSANAPTNTNTLGTASVPASTSEPRRFHMSRKDMLLAASPHPGRPHGGISKKRAAPAMFVERKIKRVASSTLEKLHAANNDLAAEPLPPNASTAETMQLDQPEPRKFKKPGVAKLAAKDNRAKDRPELPKSMTDRWNVDMQQLTADMEAYAMQQIGLNLQRAEDERREQERARNSTPSKLKFKPKPPAKRYAERHPGEATQPTDREMMDVDVGHSDSDDSDYIIETYVRVPASSMGDHVPPQSVGLLVFDEEPDIEFFYGEDDESEDEWAEDEEDENAENYYTADYPDEEVASDDEFDKNPYSFRTGNASDLEEYDIDHSDDEPDGENTKSQFRTYIGRNGLRSRHL